MRGSHGHAAPPSRSLTYRELTGYASLSLPCHHVAWSGCYTRWLLLLLLLLCSSLVPATVPAAAAWQIRSLTGWLQRSERMSAGDGWGKQRVAAIKSWIGGLISSCAGAHRCPRCVTCHLSVDCWLLARVLQLLIKVAATITATAAVTATDTTAHWIARICRNTSPISIPFPFSTAVCRPYPAFSCVHPAVTVLIRHANGNSRNDHGTRAAAPVRCGNLGYTIRIPCGGSSELPPWRLAWQ